MTSKRRGLKQFTIGNSITIRDSKSINSYFKDLNAMDSTPLPKKKEIELFDKYHNGCRKSEERILHSNLRFVISVSKAFHKGNPCLELNDLIQNGNIGLIVAISKYDPSKGFRFISYAVWWIRNEILTSIKTHADGIKIPGNSRKLQGLQDRFISDFYSKNGYRPSFHETAEALATSKENIILLNNATFLKSIDENISDEDSPKLKDTLKSDSSEFDVLFSKDMIHAVNQAFECLNNKERYVLSRLYNLEGDDQSIGLLRLSHELGKTRERIRQMRKRALAKVREYSINNKMEVLNYL